MKHILAAIRTAVLVGLITSPLLGAPLRYAVVTPDFKIGDSPPVSIVSINNLGQMVGTYKTDAGYTRAFFFDGLVAKDIGDLGGNNVTPYALSDTGYITGLSELPSGVRHAFWFNGHEVLDIGCLPGGTYSVAQAINDAGDVTGSGDSAMGMRSFLFRSSDYSMIELGTLGYGSSAYAINNHDVIVGFSDAGPPGIFGPIHAFYYSEGRMIDIGDLNDGFGASGAYDVNDRGEIIGYSDLPEKGVRHAFLFQNEAFRDLGTLGTGIFSEAHAINNFGQIVGFSWSNPRGGVAAFLFDRDKMFNLASLVEPIAGQMATFSATAGVSTQSLLGANFINDQGIIIPQTLDGFPSRAFYLQPVTSGRLVNFSVRGSVGGDHGDIIIGYAVSNGSRQLLLSRLLKKSVLD